MPNRFIKESSRSSKNLDKLSDFEERLFWRLITTADDYGRFHACPALVRAACFPYRSSSITLIEKALLGLQAQCLIKLYQVDDRKFGVFVTWEKHQGKPRSSKSKYPAPLDMFLQADASKCLQMQTVPDNHALPPDTDTDTDTDLILNSSSLNSSDSEFEQFWEAYPRKVGKKAAQKAFRNAQNRPRIDDLLKSIAEARASPQWRKEGGQFIPHPATWLNQGRWDDKPVEVNGISDPSGMLEQFKSFVGRGQA